MLVFPLVAGEVNCIGLKNDMQSSGQVSLCTHNTNLLKLHAKNDNSKKKSDRLKTGLDWIELYSCLPRFHECLRM